jgi:rhodanese-related sulfurtransferase
MPTQDALRMTPHELHERLSQGESIVILDVRTEDALRVHPYKIPNARWIPLASVVERAFSLPRTATIVCY